MRVRFFKPVIVYICAYINSRLNQMEKRIVSQLTDAVTKVEASLKAEIAAVANALSQPNPDVADAVTRLIAVAAALDAETSQITPASAPAPVDAPAPAAETPSPAPASP